jgi:hypothetical protein
VQRFFNLWFGPPYNLRAAATVSSLTLLALTGILIRFPGLSTPQKAALLIPLLTYPVVYYFMNYMPRYRVPIDWLVYLWAGAGIVSVIMAIPKLFQR